MKKWPHLITIISIGILSSGCGFFNQADHDLFNFFWPGKRIEYEDKNSTSPILDFLNKQHSKQFKKIQNSFDIPNYTENNREIFNWLATRVISVVSLIKKTNNLHGPKNVYYLDFGTATILGATNQKDKNHQDYEFYLASNAHVFSSFNNEHLKHNNSELIASFFSFNPYFAQLINQNKFPSQQDLLTNIDKLLLNTSNIRLNSNGNIRLNSNGNYYPFTFDPNFSWFAKNIKINGVQNGSSTISGESSQLGNYQFAGDFAVIRASFKPALDYYYCKNSLLTRSRSCIPLTYYLNNLTSNVQKYGDIQFDKTNATTGYMLGYPVSNAQNDDKRTVTVNLKINSLNNPQLRAAETNPDINHLLKIGNQLFLTPTNDYGINELNIGGGSSGTPLIIYDDKAKNDKQKFKMNGIYWGITYYATANAQDDKKDARRIQNSQGRITKLISPNNYDLIGNQSITNTPNQNNLCDFLKTKDQSYTPGFCTSSSTS